MKYAIINGEVVQYDEAKLHISDLGLRRGYAVFEFFRIVRGVPLFIDDHLARLARSAALADLPLPHSAAQFKALIERLIHRNHAQDAAMQLIVTGGYAEDGFSVTAPNLIVTPVAVEALPERCHRHGVALMSHRHVRELPEAKSTAYLTALALARQMRAQGAIDIVYYDDARVYEASRSGLAFITKGVFVTASERVLESVTMKRLLPLARAYMPVEARSYTLAELLSADEVLITGAIRGVLLVTHIDDCVIGGGVIGPHGQALRAAFEAQVASYVNRRARIGEEE
jgi:D-alanine transaminase/branched-chain amino acid aminotransferase